MKEKLNKLNDIFSNVMLVLMAVLFLYVAGTTLFNAYNGNENFPLFGHRIIHIQTGSMEPAMMTNCLAINKRVKDIDDIKEGDIVTFRVENDMGDLIRITHRVTDIQDGYIYTKGDNNRVEDGIPLTMENVNGKVTYIANWAVPITTWMMAALVQIKGMLGTTTGTIMLVAFVASCFFLVYLVKSLIRGKEEEDEVTSDLAEIYYDVARKLGKTPREMFIADTERHQQELKEKEAAAQLQVPADEAMEGAVTSAEDVADKE